MKRSRDTGHDASVCGIGSLASNLSGTEEACRDGLAPAVLILYWLSGSGTQWIRVGFLLIIPRGLPSVVFPRRY
jgi:hypothetical protein